MARISTALAAGRAEVRLNHARLTSRMVAKDFDAKMNAKLSAAETDKEVMGLLK